MTIFRDLTIVNNDVGNDAEVPEHDRGQQHDVSDHRNSVMFNAGHHAHLWIARRQETDIRPAGGAQDHNVTKVFKVQSIKYKDQDNSRRRES